MPRAAFFSLSPSPPAPPANEAVLDALRAQYPDHEFDVFYVSERLYRSPAALSVAIALAGWAYAGDILRQRKKLRQAVFRTPWMFRWIKAEAARLVDPGRYAFSFQMQSLFDASVPGLPHFVYTDHAHLENLKYEGQDPSGLYSPAWIDCERLVYRNAAAIFTRSSNISRALVAEYGCPREQVRCVFAGSNTLVPDHVPADLPRYAKRRIVFVGIDWDRKGGPTLLSAFRRVLTRHPDARLTIVGCSPDVGDLPNCDIVGKVPLAEVSRHLLAASVFCMPTRVEPFGIVFVEAMWHQLPIVATDVGAVPDMVRDGENGFTVRPDDAEALAERLVALLDDPEKCRQFGHRSRQLAEDHYKWPAVARKMADRIGQSLAG